jgi:hypothetical protein
MKIAEVVVGNAGAENFMLHNEPDDEVPPRNDKHPPQVGYKMRIGNRVVPTARYNSKDVGGTVGSNVPS